MNYSNSLADYFYKNRKRIIHKWPHYFEIYDRYFSRFRETECVIVEIGVYQGGSLQMWKEYFGDKARIYGIDIDPRCKQYEEESIQIFIGSQADTVFLESLVQIIPKIDILIDDGGHWMHQQIGAFMSLFQHIQPEGIYLCEDTMTSYLPEYRGGYERKGTFMEFAKSLVDALHQWHIPNSDLIAGVHPSSLDAIHFHDGIVVVEKKSRVQPWSEMRGVGAIDYSRVIDSREVERFRLKLKLLGVGLPDHMDVGHLMTNESILHTFLGELYDGRTWPDKGETMIGFLRLSQLEKCVLQVLEDHIPGDFIETGVWKGGACIFMAALLLQKEEKDRCVWLADSFAGLPPPNPDQFPADKDDIHYQYDTLAVGQEEVLANFSRYSIPLDQVKVLKGWFKDTLPFAPIQSLAILRLDGDMYESTIDALYYLYPKLEIGGFCIIDDWGAVPGCRKAVEDYRQVMQSNEQIYEIDWTGVFWRKDSHVPPIERLNFLNSLISLHGI
jgi:O-methyltransferase